MNLHYIKKLIPVEYLLISLSVLALANSDGHCVMRGSCDVDDFTGLQKPCVYNGSAVALTNKTAIDILRNYCPDLKTGTGGEVCCDADQIYTFKNSLEMLGSLFQRCPSCFYNLANLFCQFLCSPKQSQFLEVTASKNNSVEEMSYYITEHYTNGLFDSCKDVKLSFTTSRAIEIACGAKSADCTPHDWLEYMGAHDPSPYQINFQFESCGTVAVSKKTFYPMNATIIPCSKAVSVFSTSCSCVDCPSACPRHL